MTKTRTHKGGHTHRRRQEMERKTEQESADRKGRQTGRQAGRKTDRQTGGLEEPTTEHNKEGSIRRKSLHTNERGEEHQSNRNKTRKARAHYGTTALEERQKYRTQTLHTHTTT